MKLSLFYFFGSGLYISLVILYTSLFIFHEDYNNLLTVFTYYQKYLSLNNYTCNFFLKKKKII